MHRPVPGARETARWIRSGERSAVEVVTEHLERAAAEGPRVGAFTVLVPERALAEAAEVDARRTSDPGSLGPLSGVPIPIKDLTDVAGVPMSAGSAAVDLVPELDDPVVQRLRAAGAIVTGKTATPEFGLPCYTEPAGLPPARTPWDLRRSAGGSSGGAAAAVAAGLAPVAHGSDGGGSIRIPAACCGLIGLKPSRGVISPGHPEGFGLATQGVLTSSVDDQRLLMEVMAAATPGDWWPDPRRDADTDRQLRIAVLTDPLVIGTPVHPEALRAVEIAAAALAAAGHQVEPVTRPFPPEDWEVFGDVWAVMALAAPVPLEREHLLRPLTRWLRANGRGVDALGLTRALLAMQQLTRTAESAWQHHDAVLTPALSGPPSLIGELRDDDDPARDFDAQRAFTPWASIWNITGGPSVSVPVHTARVDDVVLPFSVLLSGQVGQDELMLSLAETVHRDPYPSTAGSG